LSLTELWQTSRFVIQSGKGLIIDTSQASGRGVFDYAADRQVTSAREVIAAAIRTDHQDSGRASRHLNDAIRELLGESALGRAGSKRLIGRIKHRSSALRRIAPPRKLAATRASDMRVPLQSN
jgi:hypothetical protein